MRVRIKAKKLKLWTTFDRQFHRLRSDISKAQEQVFYWNGYGNKAHRLGIPLFDTNYIIKDPCVYCVIYGEHNSDKTIDHIRALSRGGNDDWRNKAASCQHHNFLKGRKQLLRFLMGIHYETQDKL